MKRSAPVAPFIIGLAAFAFGLFRHLRPVVSGATDNSPQWGSSLSAGLAEARRTGKPVFVDLYATWCGPCKILDKSYDRQPLADELKKWVPVKIDVDQDQATARQLKADGLPTMVFLSPEGKELGRKMGFKIEHNVNSDSELFAMVAKQVTTAMAPYNAKVAVKPT